MLGANSEQKCAAVYLVKQAGSCCSVYWKALKRSFGDEDTCSRALKRWPGDKDNCKPQRQAIACVDLGLQANSAKLICRTLS